MGAYDNAKAHGYKEVARPGTSVRGCLVCVSVRESFTDY